ncbi:MULTISPECIES: ABC transporter substrate-binding protein [Paracoccus]|uniref:ABC transporter substrate-binding protein n=1 Tax=Paracoccus litorisediminis TaxID=2006130 RepID=A0A844HK37_9RHOB|nr:MULTISPECIES: ABC transporter substrate-binding protein [Paracoccus]MBD9527664.1 ABC transporter substrate-binding protein [Paracoccus sp. PAR01]MTH60300.1 ABC transporter substrate-binding protein [Paracoccus litorisediminis]
MPNISKLAVTKLAAALALSVSAFAAQAETVKWASRADIYSLDPNSIPSTSNLAFLNHIYEGLVRYDKTFGLEPALATEWQLVDNKFWRFKLREGVKFHDGADFTADDVVASFKRAADPTSPLKGNMPLFKDVRKIDDHTVEIDVTSPSSLFLNDITNIFIFDAGWLKANNTELPTRYDEGKEGYATSNTNGTGPFKLESRKPDAMTVLLVNDGWWDEKKHNIDRLEFIPITSAATRIAALLSGEVDIVDSAPIQDLERLKADPSVKVLNQTELRTVFVAFNRRDKLPSGAENPFNDIRVRQAFELAIDRDMINKRVMRGLARPSGSLIAPDIAGYSAELDTYQPADPEKAKALLAEAGKEGLPLTYTCMNDESINEEDWCQAISNLLSRAGFQPSIDMGPRAVQSPKRSKGDTEVFNLSWANEPTLDAFSLLSQVLATKEGTFGVSNYGGWSAPALDALVKQAAEATDPAERLKLEAEALKIAKDEVLMIPLHQQPIAWATNASIEAIDLRADNKPRHWFTVVGE